MNDDSPCTDTYIDHRNQWKVPRKPQPVVDYLRQGMIAWLRISGNARIHKGSDYSLVY